MANSVVNQVKVGSTTYDMKPYLGSATSGDNTTANSWTAVSTAIANTDSYDTVFNKVTSMVRNVRYLYNKLGTTDFSGISSTVSGALTTLNSGKSDTTHNHDSTYAAKSHSHNNYSTTGHTHNNYSTTGHTHNQYSPSIHNHDSDYAAKSHSHNNYSTTGHTHSNYSTSGHSHSDYSTTGHTHSYIATSNIVTSQTNSSSKVPAASLVYSMNNTLNTLNSTETEIKYLDTTDATSELPAETVFNKAYSYLFLIGYDGITGSIRSITTSYKNITTWSGGGSSYKIYYKKSSNGKTIYTYDGSSNAAFKGIVIGY